MVDKTVARLISKKRQKREASRTFSRTHTYFFIYCLGVVCRNLRSYLLGDVPLDGAENVS